MKKFLIVVFTVAILLGACTSTPGTEGSQKLETPAIAEDLVVIKTNTPAPTYAPTATPTPTAMPSPTSTPAPVSVSSALRNGSFGKISEFNKGRIELSVFSPDGKKAAFIVNQGIYVYNPSTWEEITFLPVEKNITCAVFSADGSEFAFGDDNGMITFRDADDWKVLNEFDLKTGPIRELNIAPDHSTFVTINGNRGSYTLNLWNRDDAALVKMKKGLDLRFYNNYQDLNYSADGSQIMAVEGIYGDVQVFTAADLNYHDKIPYMGEGVLSPSTKLLATCRFGELAVYDTDTRERRTIDQVKGWFDSRKVQMMFVDDKWLLISRDGEDFLINVNDSEVQTPSKNMLAALSAKNPQIGIVAFSEKLVSLGFNEYGLILGITPDGRYLILDDGMFDTFSGLMVPETRNSIYEWGEFFFLDNGEIGLVRVDRKRREEDKAKVIITRFDTEKFLMVSKTIEYVASDDRLKYPEQVALSPDGNLLAAGLQNGTLCLLQLNSADEPLCVKRAHSEVSGPFGMKFAYRDISFTSGSDQFITKGMDGNVYIWNIDTLAEGEKTKYPTGIISPDQLLVADWSISKSRDSTITIQQIADKSASIKVEEPGKDFRALLFTPDGSFLLASGFKDLVVYDVNGLQKVFEQPGAPSVLRMVISPDGNYIFGWGYGGVISIWGSQ